MQYIILTTTGYRTAEGLVSKYRADAKVLDSEVDLLKYIVATECEDDEAVLEVNTTKYLGTVGDFLKLEQNR